MAASPTKIDVVRLVAVPLWAGFLGILLGEIVRYGSAPGGTTWFLFRLYVLACYGFACFMPAYVVLTRGRMLGREGNGPVVPLLGIMPWYAAGGAWLYATLAVLLSLLA